MFLQLGFSVSQRHEIFAMYGGKCAMCPRTWDQGFMLECHHIEPVSLGGENKPINGQLLCRECHAYTHENLAQHAFELGHIKESRVHGAAARMIRDRIKKKGIMRYGYE